MSDQAMTETKRTWDRAAGATFAQWMESRVARFATRRYDWNALKFQADYDPKYRRAQMRYVGTGGTGVKSDSSVVPAEHFTFSTMLLPAGAEGPMHIHNDVEEIFFVMRGKVKVSCEKDGEMHAGHGENVHQARAREGLLRFVGQCEAVAEDVALREGELLRRQSLL